MSKSWVEPDPVWSKNSKHVRRQGMMSAPDERKQVAAPARVRNRVSQSGIACPERVLGCGESDFTCAPASVFALIRSREIHLGRNRQANWAQGSGPGGLCGQAGHDFGLVPETDCPEVRWLETPSLPRQTANRSKARGADRADGQREFRLGVRPDRGRSGQSRLSGVG